MKKVGNTNFGYVLWDKHTTPHNLRKQLITLYETPWCDPVFLNLLCLPVSEDNCFKLFLYENETLKHIVLFQGKGGSARHINVLNHCFKISQQDIETICNIIFSEYIQCKKITFPFLFLEEEGKKPLMLFYKRQSDIIIDLPESMDVYMKSLGNHTRKSVKVSRNSIEKDHPDFKISFFEAEHISSEQVISLMGFNRERMKSKGKTCLSDDQECENIFQYAHNEGGLVLCTIGENIIGGTINFMLGEHAYLDVIAHDNAYSKYRAGYLALTGTIQYLIERKIRYFHLLWGEEDVKYRNSGDYKYRFLGKDHILYDVLVCKNRTEYVLNSYLFTIRSLIKTLKKKLKKNVMLNNIYKKICLK